MTPTELYHFTDNITSWYYTSADHDITHDGNTYISTTMGRNEIESKGSIQRENIEIAFALDNPMARQFLLYNPENIVMLTIYVNTNVGLFVGWKGRYAVIRPEKSTIKLVFESIFTSLKRTGLRQSYQRGCRHMLYDSACRVDKNMYLSNAVVSNVAKYNVTLTAPVSGKPDGYFNGGVIAYQGGMRGIIKHEGNLIVLTDLWHVLKKASDISHSETVLLYPGCERTSESCKSKFSNFANFGGFPFIPFRNPMDGSSIT